MMCSWEYERFEHNRHQEARAGGVRDTQECFLGSRGSKKHSRAPLFDCSNFSLHSDKGTTRQTGDVDAPAHHSS